RPGEELELARGRREPLMGAAVDLDADRLVALADELRRGVDRGAVEVFRRGRLLVGAIDVVLDQEGAVLALVLVRRAGGALPRRREPRHAVLEDPLIE